MSNINSQGYRHSLPEKVNPEEKISIVSVLSKAIGTDITRMTMPGIFTFLCLVFLNEPLSALQRGCETMYYSELLDKAD